MSETASLNKKTVHFEAPDEGGEGSGRVLEGPFRDDNDSSGDQGAAPAVENFKSPSINAAATSLNEESKQPAAVKGKLSDETIENLVALFRDFLEAAPNPARSNHTPTQRNTARRKRFFGLTKGSQPVSNNRYDYEQKYPRDRPGEEVADNARVWLTYLDEAEVFDRERVDGWKETVDVLLVFAGLFSGVITTFASQASQSLQRDNTQVSASLLFEIAQLLRAQSSGIPLNNISSSTLTPTSSFTPSTNAFLVNGLWFTSLAITLSTALFAVLAKQWLYYYLSSITGTAHEKARARQLRFNGFELWKVGAIVDLLPILLHLAVGIFLTGIIILLFPLDIQVAWTIVIITGITYFLYFVSVILPIRYPECPYTTSLTIYIGILFFFLQEVLRWIGAILNNLGFQAARRKIALDINSFQHLLRYTHDLFRHAFSFILRLVGPIGRGFRTLRSSIFTEQFPEFTKWREEHNKKAVEDAALLDFEALHWLYATSPNRSVRRIIARCVAVHPIISQRFEYDNLYYLQQALEVSDVDIVDLRYGLCLDLQADETEHWRLLQSITDVEESQLEEAEYQSYSHIAEKVLLGYNHAYILKDGINNDLKLPLAMWCYFFKEASGDPTNAVHILTSRLSGLFEWKPDPTRESIHNVGAVSLDIEELEWWKFECLYRHFLDNTKPDYSLDKTFETRYLLFITIYRNLTSDEPLISDKEQRQKSLSNLFNNFWIWRYSKPRATSEQYLAFFIDVCCVDAFWSDLMTDKRRLNAARCLDQIWLMDTDVTNRFLSTECHDLSPIYQWCSRDLDPGLSWRTTPIFTLLFMPQNRTRLCTILSNDSNAVFRLSKCFQNSWDFGDLRSGFMHRNLIDLLKSVNPKVPLFNILYNSSVLVQLWKFLVFRNWDAKKIFLLIRSKLDQEKLNNLYAVMNEQVYEDLYAIPPRSYRDTDALKASAHEFGHIIGVSRPRLESTTEQSAPDSCAADRDHDIEERAQVPDANEGGGLQSIANWTTKAFKPVWSKTSIK